MTADRQSARVAALAIAVRREPDVVQRLRMSELPELLTAALEAVPIARAIERSGIRTTFMRWRSTCPVLHDAAVSGYWLGGSQRCRRCDRELMERGRTPA